MWLLHFAFRYSTYRVRGLVDQWIWCSTSNLDVQGSVQLRCAFQPAGRLSLEKCVPGITSWELGNVVLATLTKAAYLVQHVDCLDVKSGAIIIIYQVLSHSIKSNILNQINVTSNSTRVAISRSYLTAVLTFAIETWMFRFQSFTILSLEELRLFHTC